MSHSGYDSAFEQATNERAEIRVQIEKLLTRGENLDKLLECLAPFVTSPKAVEAEPSSEHHAEPQQEHHEHHEQHHEYQQHHQG